MNNLEKIESLQAKIMQADAELAELRIQYRAADKVEKRGKIVEKANMIKKMISDYEKDLGLYERIERAKEISKEIRAKKGKK